MKKVAAIVVAIACLAALAGGIVFRLMRTGAGAEGRRAAPPVAVEIVRPVQRTMRDVAEFTGTLLPDSRFVVAPKVPGRLERLLVNIGDHVGQGDLIAVLDSAEYAQQVAQAEAELEVSQATLADSRSALEVAQREYDRARELHAEQVASEAELDQAKARYDAAVARMEVAKAQIEQRKAALAGAQVRLSYTSIRAGWEDGRNEGVRTIAERFVDEGAMLRANDPIVSIVDLNSVIAVIHVIERDFPRIRLGQPAAVVTDAHPDRVFTGQVIRMAPVLQEATRQARVEVAIPNPERLLAAGMFARARLQFAELPEVTAIPVAAMVRRDGREGVFVAEAASATARFVPVETGITEGAWVQIVSPPLDQPVVTLGQHLLTDGAAIRIPDAPDARDDDAGRIPPGMAGDEPAGANTPATEARR